MRGRKSYAETLSSDDPGQSVGWGRGENERDKKSEGEDSHTRLMG